MQVWFSKDKSKHKIFFSNDLTLAGTDIVKTYRQYLMNRFICVSGISADNDLIAKLNEEVFSLTTMQYDTAA